MGFEKPPQEPSANKHEIELANVQAEIEATINEIRSLDPKAPEMTWLKEKLKELDGRLRFLEKPELRTPEFYGKQTESSHQKDIDFFSKKLRGAEPPSAP